jgi:signal transduction histidine kinase
MRDKIARDLHDDIGSTLSGINIFSKIALQQMRPGEPGMELMEKISERSKKTMDALSDIVWSINTRNDSMDNFLMRANEYLSVLEVQDIAYDFTIDEGIRQSKIGMILKKELYLIFKEAICNASKYARCSFIQIYLTGHKNICTLYIRDNGKGFNIDSVSSGNGIYNMRQRAKKMNAEFRIESEENNGTTITLNFRITRFR